jgi:glycosyltransferase involved in cell wall biosynthesis
MHVGVNLLWCRPGQVGGSEEYVARQLVGLSSADPTIAARLVVPPGYAAAHPELAARFELVTAGDSTRHRGGRLLAEVLALPRQVAGCDVVHHAGGTLPLHWRGVTLLTVHDVQYLRYPHYFSPVRRGYLRWRMPRSVRRATAIAVPSRFVAAALTDAFGVAAERMVVVPHGYDAPPAGALPGDAELRRRYGLGSRRVIVYPAVTHPHKRHRLLLELLAGPWAADDLVLVLLGGAGVAERSVAAAIGELDVGARVVRPGRVPAADRDGLIVLADWLVFPSEYEGFGAPALEAMALGTPVICSDQTALPEVVGDAAVVRPLTVGAWAGALDAVDAMRPQLIERGRQRAAGFTTAVSGAALAAAYCLALGGRR